MKSNKKRLLAQVARGFAVTQGAASIRNAKLKAPHKLTDPWKALQAGQKAKAKGWSDTCPFSDVAGLFYFRAGYNGITMHEIALAQYNLQGLTAADPVFAVNRPVLVREIFTGGWNDNGQAFIR